MKVLVLALVGLSLWGQDGASQTSYRLSPAAPLTNVHDKFVNVRTSTDYNWVAQRPGGTMTGGISKTVTMNPCPVGLVVSGTYATPIYISGGTGTAESVTGTGGTCGTSGGSGTVIFTPANSHSGSWTIQSSTNGIMESVAANPRQRIRIPAGLYDMHGCMVFDPLKALTLSGDGYDPSGSGGTILSFVNAPVCTAAITVSAAVGFPIEPITFEGMLIQGNGTSTGGSGILLQNITRVSLDNVMLANFPANGLLTQNAFEIYISNRSSFQSNGRWGAAIVGTSNLVSITDSFFGFNSRLDGYGNIAIVGTGTGASASEAVYLKGVDSEVAGTTPFTTVTAAYGMVASNITSLTVIGSYFEGSVGGPMQILYNGGITSLTEFGNFINGAGAGNGILYAADTRALNSWGNTFWGTAARTFNSSDLSTYKIGPDTCITSTECTTHANMLGSVSSLSTTGAFSAAIAANYIGTESGANNAIIVALLDQSGSAVPLAAGLQFKVKLAHTLQAGANTVTFNGTTKNIRSHINTANNISSAYSVGGIITLIYDGTQCLDESQ